MKPVADGAKAAALQTALEMLCEANAAMTEYRQRQAAAGQQQAAAGQLLGQSAQPIDMVALYLLLHQTELKAHAAALHALSLFDEESTLDQQIAQLQPQEQQLPALPRDTWNVYVEIEQLHQHAISHRQQAYSRLSPSQRQQVEQLLPEKEADNLASAQSDAAQDQPTAAATGRQGGHKSADKGLEQQQQHHQDLVKGLLQELPAFLTAGGTRSSVNGVQYAAARLQPCLAERASGPRAAAAAAAAAAVAATQQRPRYSGAATSTATACVASFRPPGSSQRPACHMPAPRNNPPRNVPQATSPAARTGAASAGAAATGAAPGRAAAAARDPDGPGLVQRHAAQQHSQQQPQAIITADQEHAPGPSEHAAGTPAAQRSKTTALSVAGNAGGNTTATVGMVFGAYKQLQQGSAATHSGANEASQDVQFHAPPQPHHHHQQQRKLPITVGCSVQAQEALTALTATLRGSVADYAAERAQAEQPLQLLADGRVRLVEPSTVIPVLRLLCEGVDCLLGMTDAAVGALHERPFSNILLPKGSTSGLLVNPPEDQLISAGGIKTAVRMVNVGYGESDLKQAAVQAVSHAVKQHTQDQPHGLRAFLQDVLPSFKQLMGEGVTAPLNSTAPAAQACTNHVCGLAHVGHILCTVHNMLLMPAAAPPHQGQQVAAAAQAGPAPTAAAAAPAVMPALPRRTTHPPAPTAAPPATGPDCLTVMQPMAKQQQQLKRFDFAAWELQQEQQLQQGGREPTGPPAKRLQTATAANEPVGQDLAAANTGSEPELCQLAPDHESGGSAGLMQSVAPPATAATTAPRRSRVAKRKAAVLQGQEPAAAPAASAAAPTAAPPAAAGPDCLTVMQPLAKQQQRLKRIDFAAWEGQQEQQLQQLEGPEPTGPPAKRLQTATAAREPVRPELAAANTNSEPAMCQQAPEHESGGSAGLMQSAAPPATEATEAPRRSRVAKRKAAVLQGPKPAAAPAASAAAPAPAPAPAPTPTAVTVRGLSVHAKPTLAAFAAAMPGSVAAVVAGHAKAEHSLLALGSGPVPLAGQADPRAMIMPLCNALDRLMRLDMTAGLQQRPFLYGNCSSDPADGFAEQVLATVSPTQLETVAGIAAALSNVRVGPWQQEGCGLGAELVQAAEGAEAAQLLSDEPQGLTDFLKSAVPALQRWVTQGVTAPLQSSLPPAQILQDRVNGVAHVTRILATLHRMLQLPRTAAEQGQRVAAAAAAAHAVPYNVTAASASAAATPAHQAPAAAPTAPTLPHAAAVATGQAPAVAVTASAAQLAEQALRAAMQSASAAAEAVLSVSQLQDTGGVQEELPGDETYTISTADEVQHLVKLHCCVVQRLLDLSPSSHATCQPLAIQNDTSPSTQAAAPQAAGTTLCTYAGIQEAASVLEAAERGQV